MTYQICASTPKVSVAVVREDPASALAKIKEFEELGLMEVVVTTDAGAKLTREQLLSLARDQTGMAA